MKIATPFYPQAWNLEQWAQMGFTNKQEASFWESRSCGVLSLKMAVDAFLARQRKSVSPAIAEYIRHGVGLGVYKDPVGWNHQGLARLADSFGFTGAAHIHTTPEELRTALLENKLPIISIKWAFENQRSLKEKILFWKRYGGHLALVVGFEEEGDSIAGFYIHHTSIRPEYNWEYKFVPLSKLENSFTGRTIYISQK